MVCTFMLFVLPALILRACYAFWGWLTGRKPEEPKEAETNADKRAPAAKGVCPYHVVLRFFGFKVPEKKQATDAPLAEPAPVADDRVKAE